MEYITTFCPRCKRIIISHCVSTKYEEICGAEYIVCPFCYVLIKTKSNILKKIENFNNLTHKEKIHNFRKHKVKLLFFGPIVMVIGILLTYFIFFKNQDWGAILVIAPFAISILLVGLAMIHSGFTEKQSDWEKDMKDKLDENKYIVKYWEYHNRAHIEELKKFGLSSFDDFFKLEAELIKRTKIESTPHLKYMPIDSRINTVEDALFEKN